MNCKIKIIAGPESGQEHEFAVDTVIGRSPRCAIRLSSPGVSYEHAMISRTGNEYFIENLSANGTYINGDRIASRMRLRVRDQIRLGAGTTGAPETSLRVEALPAAARAESSRKWMIITVGILLVILVAVLLIDPLGEEASANWGGAYAKLQEFVVTESAEKRLPENVPMLLREAWRLQNAGDAKGAHAMWLRLHVLLNETDAQTDIQRLARENRSALEKLINPQPKTPAPTDQEKLAALLQFITAMERRK